MEADPILLLLLLFLIELFLLRGSRGGGGRGEHKEGVTFPPPLGGGAFGFFPFGSLLRGGGTRAERPLLLLLRPLFEI